jgi:2-C-methyl-D-erythritol 2,4-cyclodiphosphate synthase
VLHISEYSINIKATTCEGMGFAGRREGMAAYAVVSLVGSNL